MTHQLQIDFNQMREVGQALLTEADRVEVALTLLESEAEALYDFWQGLAQQSFSVELATCKPMWRSAPTRYRRLGQALIDTADLLEAADQEVARGMGGQFA